MFSMRYCKDCLIDYREKVAHLRADEYIVLRVPVEDEWGMIFTAHQAMKAGELRALLNSSDAVIDLAKHSVTLRIEDVRTDRRMPSLSDHIHYQARLSGGVH